MRVAPVSVVIPSYNAGRFVGEAVESVLRQTLVPLEVIVVDDGSTDDTAAILGAFAGRINYVRQSNSGVSAARNRGVAAATQEWVAFLDADDVWHPRKIELQMRALARHSELVLLSAGAFDWPCDRMPSLPEGDGHVAAVSWAQLVVKNELPSSAVVARRSVLRAAGSFDTQMQGPEDRDLWLRVAERGPVGRLELRLMGYRDVDGSVSKNAVRCRAGMLRILEKIDRRDVWAGRRWLRRKAYSYVHHSCAEIFSSQGMYGDALKSSLRSLAWYPFPYSRDVATEPAERGKRLAVSILRRLGLKSRGLPGLSVRGTRVEVRPAAAAYAGVHLRVVE